MARGVGGLGEQGIAGRLRGRMGVRLGKPCAGRGVGGAGRVPAETAPSSVQGTGFEGTVAASLALCGGVVVTSLDAVRLEGARCARLLS